MRVIVSWDPSSETDVAGYRVYWSTDPQVSPNNYNGVILTGDTSTTVPELSDPDSEVVELPDGKRVYFCVTAFDVAGNESPASNTVTAINKLTPFARL